MIVYVSGAIRPKKGQTLEGNLKVGKDIAYELWKKGYVVICPHANTDLDPRVYDGSDGVTWLDGDLDIISRCDAVVVCPDSEKSFGTDLEIKHARARDIPVYYYPDLPEISFTEKMRPYQVRAYIDVVMKGYRVHLDKNGDYSAANIIGTGEIGLMTRLWDKIARLMNLMGFRVEVQQAWFDKPKNAKCETVDDTIMDAGVYSIIWQLFRAGWWGK